MSTQQTVCKINIKKFVLLTRRKFDAKDDGWKAANRAVGNL